ARLKWWRGSLSAMTPTPSMIYTPIRRRKSSAAHSKDCRRCSIENEKTKTSRRWEREIEKFLRLDDAAFQQSSGSTQNDLQRVPSNSSERIRAAARSPPCGQRRRFVKRFDAEIPQPQSEPQRQRNRANAFAVGRDLRGA